MRKKNHDILLHFNDGLYDEVYHEKRFRRSLIVKSLKERIRADVNSLSKLKNKMKS